MGNFDFTSKEFEKVFKKNKKEKVTLNDQYQWWCEGNQKTIENLEEYNNEKKLAYEKYIKEKKELKLKKKEEKRLKKLKKEK